MEKITIGVSACLLGQQVRFDGGHKLDRYITETLGQYVEYVPVCPEVECGLGIPRESMHLEGDPLTPRLVTFNSKKDITVMMVKWAQERVKALEQDDLCGFIFKSNSPSSGMERVRVYDEKGVPRKLGVGIFARIFMEYFPLLPVEDEGRLHDPRLRENFIERIFVFKRWRETLSKGKRPGQLVDFHMQHKLLIMAHSPKHYRDMGKLVANQNKISLKDLYSQYQILLMESLAFKATVKKNTNVLYHLMGYFKNLLTSDEKQELLEVIGYYHQDHLPLIVPITLINHYVRKYAQPYLKQQVYLNPHPIALQLRNHV